MSNAPATVLIIENHPMMRAAISAAIADEPGLTIAAIAASGADVMPMVATLRPDLILFSVGNPGLEDMSAMEAIHKLMPSTPILALTSDEVPNQEQVVLDRGAKAVLTKTASRAELLGALRKLGGQAKLKEGASIFSEEANGAASP